MAKRQTKYYVSTYDGAFNGGIKRLTPYYTDWSMAKHYYDRVFYAYNTLMLRSLAPDNKTRKTLLKKSA